MDIIGYRRERDCHIGYLGFARFRGWCLDLMPPDFQLVMKLWLDSEDPGLKVPDEWLRGKHDALEFFMMHDYSGEFCDTEAMTGFLKVLDERASSRLYENEVEQINHAFLREMIRVFESCDYVRIW